MGESRRRPRPHGPKLHFEAKLESIAQLWCRDTWKRRIENRMNRISFAIISIPLHTSVWPEIVAEVDGVALTLLAKTYETEHELKPVGNYGGLCPIHYRFGDWDDYFHGYRKSGMSVPDKVALLNCNCGVFTCWPLLATVETDFEVVVWKDFEHPFHRDRDYSGLGPFVFDWYAYEDAVVELQQRIKREFLPEATE